LPILLTQIPSRRLVLYRAFLPELASTSEPLAREFGSGRSRIVQRRTPMLFNRSIFVDSPLRDFSSARAPSGERAIPLFTRGDLFVFRLSPPPFPHSILAEESSLRANSQRTWRLIVFPPGFLFFTDSNPFPSFPYEHLSSSIFLLEQIFFRFWFLRPSICAFLPQLHLKEFSFGAVRLLSYEVPPVSTPLEEEANPGGSISDVCERSSACLHSVKTFFTPKCPGDLCVARSLPPFTSHVLRGFVLPRNVPHLQIGESISCPTTSSVGWGFFPQRSPWPPEFPSPPPCLQDSFFFFLLPVYWKLDSREPPSVMILSLAFSGSDCFFSLCFQFFL